MALGRQGERQADLMLSWAELPRSPGHAFHDRLQAVLVEAGFDRFAEGECAPYYAGKRGRPSLPPGRYFRTCNYPHLSTPNQRLAGFVQIVSICAELFEGPPRQVTLLGSNIDRSRNYSGPCGWSEMWVIASGTGRLPSISSARRSRGVVEVRPRAAFFGRCPRTLFRREVMRGFLHAGGYRPVQRQRRDEEQTGESVRVRDPAALRAEAAALEVGKHHPESPPQAG